MYNTERLCVGDAATTITTTKVNNLEGTHVVYFSRPPAPLEAKRIGAEHPTIQADAPAARALAATYEMKSQTTGTKRLGSID